MSISISSLIPITPIAPSLGAGAAPAAGKFANFASALDGAIQGVEGPRQEANQAVQNLLNGDGELHTVALAAQRADLAFDLGLQVRNKIVSAYQEVMRMQL
ncbi:MAG: flagellar hook-basal body complex protein FliE [Candidatus Solibacter sp.]